MSSADTIAQSGRSKPSAMPRTAAARAAAKTFHAVVVAWLCRWREP